MQGGLVGIGDVVFGAAKAFGESGEPGPFGALESEKDFVEIAIPIFAAAEGGFHFGVNGQGLQDIFDRFIEQRVGDGEEPHEKHRGAFFAEAGGSGKLLAEIGAGEGGVDQFRGLAGTHSNDHKDGNPAAEFGFSEKRDGVADAVNFGAQGERGRVEISEQAIEQGRILLEKRVDGVVVEIGSGDGTEKLELEELVAGNIAGFEHRGLAEKIALKVAVAKIPGFVKIVPRFHFFGQKRKAIAKIFFRNTLPAIRIEKSEIDFQIVSEIDKGLESGLAEKIVESQRVTILAKFAADADDFVGGLHALEDFDDDALRRKQPGSAEAESEFIHVDESAGVASEILQVGEGQGIGDDAGRSVIASLEKILRAAAKKKLVGIHTQPLVKNGLAGDELFMHTGTVARRSEPLLLGPR